MALFFIEKENTGSVIDCNCISVPGVKFYWQFSSFDNQSYHLNTDKSFVFASTRPVLKSNTGEFGFADEINDLQETIVASQNDYAAIQFKAEGTEFKLVASSARFTRARVYFVVQKNRIIFSNSLKQLLPFSSKKINPAGAFSILKYGETPEYVNFIEDIFSVPNAHFLSLNASGFNEVLKQGTIRLDQFTNFFQISFPGDGGNINTTGKKLDSLFSLIGSLPIIVPISGGVDSTVINHLVNKGRTQAYPSFFLQFGPEDGEVQYAQWAVKNTRAELEVCQMNPNDFEPAFEYQTEMLNQPLGESSAIAMAHFFRTCKISDHFIIDGTLADGTYGSTNYNKDLWGNQKKRSLFEQRMAERISSVIQANNWKKWDRFFPRDSFQKDEYVRFLHQYLGAFANTWIDKAEQYTNELDKYWNLYYSELDVNSRNDDWARYTIFKMVNYACKNNTAKSFDLARPKNNAFYPFTWKEVLEDQGHYSWKEKTTNNIIKYPLKKILENYIDKEFIYRKKVGLNSSFEDWISTPSNKKYLVALIDKPGGIADFMIGSRRKKQLVSIYQRGEIHPNLSRLIINLAIQQAWIDKNRIIFS